MAVNPLDFTPIHGRINGTAASKRHPASYRITFLHQTAQAHLLTPGDFLPDDAHPATKTQATTPAGRVVTTDDRFFDKRDGTVFEVSGASDKHAVVIGYRFADRNTLRSHADIISLADIDEHYSEV